MHAHPTLPSWQEHLAIAQDPVTPTIKTLPSGSFYKLLNLIGQRATE